jgi:hypothetical protein
VRERIDDARIHGALERHDQVGKVLHRLPAPLDEFWLVAAGRVSISRSSPVKRSANHFCI